MATLMNEYQLVDQDFATNPLGLIEDITSTCNTNDLENYFNTTELPDVPDSLFESDSTSTSQSPGDPDDDKIDADTFNQDDLVGCDESFNNTWPSTPEIMHCLSSENSDITNESNGDQFCGHEIGYHSLQNLQEISSEKRPETEDHEAYSLPLQGHRTLRPKRGKEPIRKEFNSIPFNRRMRQPHSAVERRYREGINTKIDDIRHALESNKLLKIAESEGPGQEADGGMKVKKRDILTAALDYIYQSQVDMRHMANEIAYLKKNNKQSGQVKCCHSLMEKEMVRRRGLAQM